MTTSVSGGCKARERSLAGAAGLVLLAAGCAAVADGTGPAPPAGEPGLAGPAAQGSPGSGSTGSSASGGPNANADPLASLRAGSASGAAAQGAGDGERYVRGFVSARYRGRATGDEDDHDLFTTLGLDFGDPSKDAVTGSFLGRLWGDLKGDGAIFASLEDTFDSSLVGYIYHAYVDVHSVDALETLRLGRQRVWDTPEFVVFDGALVETGESSLGGINLGLYGGVPVRFYEATKAENTVLGAFAEGRPWEGGRARIDYMYLEDERRLGSGNNDLLGLSLWQFLGEGVVLEGGYTRLEGENRDVNAAASYQDPDSDLNLRLSYYQLLEPQGSFALEFDPYSSTLQQFEPYLQVGLLASKSVIENLMLQLGVDVRRLEDSADEGVYNHEFERYYLTAIVPECFAPSLTLSLTGDYWEDDQQDVQTWGLDLTHRFDERLRGSIGSFYSLYKYDLFFNRERDDVRTYYARLRYERSKTLSFDAGFDYEDDDFEEYQTLRLGAQWLF